MPLALVAPLLAALALAGLALADPAASVRLVSSGPAGLTATATLRASGSGTAVTLVVRAAPAHDGLRLLLRTGTCRHPSRGFGTVIALAPPGTAGGSEQAAGRVRLHGANVPLHVLADGAHVLQLVRQGHGVVACGAVPRAD